MFTSNFYVKNLLVSFDFKLKNLLIFSIQKFRYFPLKWMDPSWGVKIQEAYYINLMDEGSRQHYLRVIVNDLCLENNELMISWDYCDYFHISTVENQQILFKWEKWSKFPFFLTTPKLHFLLSFSLWLSLISGYKI